MDLPPLVLALAEAVRDAGGRAWLVGGWVRDLHLGLDSKDIDVEVHGLPEEQLARLLSRLGRVNAVGRSFGVYKLMAGDWELDVSLPRRDSKVGPGHRGIQVAGDPHMGLDESVRRRDLTINALLFDPLTQDTADPSGGLADLAARRLRHVDPDTFSEDPLRALRVVQFAARFDFHVDPELAQLCRDAALEELPAERIRGELDKLLLRAARPSIGTRLLDPLDIAPRLLPELTLDEAVHNAVDCAATVRSELGSRGERLTLMLSALLHRSAASGWEPLLDRLDVHTVERWPARRNVLDALRALQHPVDDRCVRAIADRMPAPLFVEIQSAIDQGPRLDRLTNVAALGVAGGPLPRLLGGRELVALGVPKGPAMGELQAAVRSAQHDGTVESVADAQALVRRRLHGAAEGE